MRAAKLCAVISLVWVEALGAACGARSLAGADLGAADLAAADGARDARAQTGCGSGPATPTGCTGYVGCLLDCGVDAACRACCDQGTTAAGRAKLEAALACAQSWCLARGDLGTGHCALSDDMTTLVDPLGAPPNRCARCLENALASLFGHACSPASDPDCSPASCADAVAACQASTP